MPPLNDDNNQPGDAGRRRAATRAELGNAAVELARAGWEVFPLTDRAKAPRRPCPHCQAPLIPPGKHGPRLCPHPRCQAPKCPGPNTCGHALCHGVLDASSDAAKVADWWTRHPHANIGARIPAGLFVIDVDPRHDGHQSLAALQEQHGHLPTTLTALSGRCDGGRHLYFVRPVGDLTARRLSGTGLDLKTNTGYVVAPPSLHPDTGRPYTWVDATLPPAPAPPWLANLLRPEPPPAPRPARPMRMSQSTGRPGESIADAFGRTTGWAAILEPHGWICLDGDPNGDGARWRHPAATNSLSATIRHGCLFVYSTGTPFEATGAGDPHGITKFRAYAVLNHNGDMGAGARHLRSAPGGRT